MSRCFRCDGVGCAECLDLADYRISQEMSGRATRDVAEDHRDSEGSSDRCATCGCERLQHGWGVCVGTVTFGLRDLGERQCSCKRFVPTYKDGVR